MPQVDTERGRRFDLWDALSEDRDDAEPQRLRDLGVYGGAQGIWVDKARTAGGEIGPDGATVAILHTGRHYPDDLSDDAVIYHYPKTGRPPGRDAVEIQATKNAMEHCGKSEKGSDDWRNGIPLCATHHQAFDAYLFGIEPSSREIRCMDGVQPDELGLMEKCLNPEKSLPHRTALEWRWTATVKAWEK